MLTTAFLGVAHIHTPSFIERLAKRGDVRVKAIYDHDAERGERRARQTGSEYFHEASHVINDPEVSSVIICSETDRHVELVEAAALAGKHVFVEKPLAISVEKANQIQRAVEHSGVIFQTGFFMRSAPQIQFLKHEVGAGHLGTITRMRYSNCHSGALSGLFDTEWRWIANADEAGGGGFADLGAHALDIVLWTLRPSCGHVERVSCSLGSATGRYGDIDEYGVGMLTFALGAVAVVEASWVDPKLRSPIEVFGTQGQMQIFSDKVYYYSEHVEGADGGEWTELPTARPHAFDLFFDKLGGQHVDLVTIEEAAEESRVMARLYESAGE